MGWRDRDWARFTDDERAVLYGGGQGDRWSPPDTGCTAPRPRRGRQAGVGTAAVVSAIAILVLAYGHLGRGPSTSTSPPPLLSPPAQNVLTIRWRAEDLAPAAQAGRICVTDPRHGRICASYVAGERPADTLTRALDARGLRVASAGAG